MKNLAPNSAFRFQNPEQKVNTRISTQEKICAIKKVQNRDVFLSSRGRVDGCAPLLANFTYSNFPLATSLAWDFGDLNTSNSTTNVTHTYLAAGCFDVTLMATTAAGCSSTLTVNNFTCAFQNASANFISTPNTTVLNSNFLFTNLSTDASSYSWRVIRFSASETDKKYAKTGNVNILR